MRRRRAKRKSVLRPHGFSQLRLVEGALKDIELDQEHRPGTRIEFYFDTAYVQEMTLGMYEFENSMVADSFSRVVFDLLPFREPKKVVPALAAAGFLGQIRMLPAHNVEFRHRESQRFGVSFDRDHRPLNMAGALFAQLISDKIGDEFLVEAKQMRLKHEEVFLSVHKLAAVSQFQLVECIQGFPDASRLSAGARPVLSLEQFDRAELLRLIDQGRDMGFFDELLAKFDDIRPGYSDNNLADTLALVSLVEKVDAYRSGASDKAPRYFFPLDTEFGKKTIHILKETDVYERLCYEVPSVVASVLDGRLSPPIFCVLQDWQYFFWHAVAWANPRPEIERREAPSYTQTEESPSNGLRLNIAADFRHTFERISAFQKRRGKKKEPPGFESYAIENRVYDFVDAGFINSVLLRYLTTGLPRALHVLEKNDKLVDELKQITKIDEDQITEFTWDTLVRTSGVYRAFSELRPHLLSRFKKYGELSWLDMRLFHFALPERVQCIIMGWMKRALDDQRQGVVKRTQVWKEIDRIYLHVLARSEVETLDQDKVVAVAALLIAGRRTEFWKCALDLLDNDECLSASVLSVRLMRLQCRVELGRMDGAIDALSSLRNEFGDSAESNVSYSLAVMHAIVAERQKASTAPSAKFVGHPDDGEALLCRNKAYEYAGRVLRNPYATPDERAASLNLNLHIRLNLAKWNSELLHEAEQALRVFENTESWQPIFSGTLLQYSTMAAARTKKDLNAARSTLESVSEHAWRIRKGPVAPDLTTLLARYDRMWVSLRKKVATPRSPGRERRTQHVTPAQMGRTPRQSESASV